MQAEVTHGTWVFWPSQSNASMFKQLHLFKAMSELASDNINGYIYPVSIHKYIQNKCLTYICEVGDPFLSQNLHRKYVISKAKQGGEMRENTRRCFKNYCIIFFGSTYKQKSCMAQSMLATAVARGRISWTGTTMPTQSTNYESTIYTYAVSASITSAFHSARCTQ